MSANEIIDSGIELPRIAAVEPLPPYTLRVKWAEGPRAGREDLVDVSPAIFSYKVYRPLRNKSLFLTGVPTEDGDAVAWDGKDLLMSADTIQSLAQESMVPRDFAGFLIRNRLTQVAAAALLGRSRRQIANYTSIGPIPRIVALACHGFEALRRSAAIARELQSQLGEPSPVANDPGPAAGRVNAQPPKAGTAPAPDRSEQPRSPAVPATPRQRVLS
jgi:Protein of unknown function (DUF2442)